MLRKFIIALCVFVGVAQLAIAQENTDDASFIWANDFFAAGNTVTAKAQNLNDVFLAGDTVETKSNLEGSAHMAGRIVTVDAPVEGNLYALGQTISVNNPINGNLSAGAQTLILDAALAGNLRAVAQTVYLNQPISGSVLLAADSVVIASHIVGDLKIFSDDVRFTDAAKVDGKLEISTANIDAMKGSENTPDQIELMVDKHSEDDPHHEPRGPLEWLIEALQDIALTTALIGILAVIFPNWMSYTAGTVVQAPFAALWSGMLSLAVILGLMLVLVLTLIGALTVPLFLIFGFVVFWLGYLVATFGIGVYVLEKFGSFDGSRVLERIIAALIGAVVVFGLSMIPFLGFFACLALGFAGLGVVIWPFISRKLPLGPTLS